MAADVRFSQLLPDRVRPGAALRDVVTSDRLNQIRDGIHALASGQHFSGNIQTQGRAGIIIRQSRPQRRGQPHPFKVLDASDGDGPKVRVLFGLVTDIPPDIGGIFLDAATPPALEISTSGVIYLDMTIHASTGEPTDCAVKQAATKPANTASKAFVAIAHVVLTDGVITSIAQAVTHSLYVRKCGDTTYDVKAV